jgi:hypothetical protein
MDPYQEIEVFLALKTVSKLSEKSRMFIPDPGSATLLNLKNNSDLRCGRYSNRMPKCKENTGTDYSI